VQGWGGSKGNQWTYPTEGLTPLGPEVVLGGREEGTSSQVTGLVPVAAPNGKAGVDRSKMGLGESAGESGGARAGRGQIRNEGGPLLGGRRRTQSHRPNRGGRMILKKRRDVKAAGRKKNKAIGARKRERGGE